MNRFSFETLYTRRVVLIGLIVATLLVWAAVGGLFLMRSQAGRPGQVTPTVPPTGEPSVTVAANASGGFSVAGFNWPANVAIELNLIPPAGTPVYWLGTVRSDASGLFSADFEWRPGQPSGEGTIVLARSGTVEATAPFTLIPPLDLTPVIPGETPSPQPTGSATGTVTATATATVTATVEPTASATPEPTATSSPVAASPTATTPGGAAGPVCVVATQLLNLRAGPGTSYHVVLELERNESLVPLARNNAADWIQVVTYDNIVGWVSRDFISCTDVNIERLPVVALPATATPVPPTATPRPASPTPVTITDWRGEYFTNSGLGGAPAVVRNDVGVSFDWGSGSPAAGIPSDYFSARWTRWWRFAPGTYRFFLRVDDGARLYVDNNLVLDMWAQGAPRTQTVDLNLSGGDHFIRVDYFEATGNAQVALWWEQPGVFTGWRGEYFTNRTLSGSPLIVRDDAAVAFNWGAGAPAPGLPDNNFSVRWTRDLDLAAGSYRFSLRADDGVRLWIDNNLVIDEWHEGSATYTRDLYLAGGRHSFKVEYFEATGGAIVELDWDRIEPSYPNWKGEYYDNDDLDGDPVLVRNDAAIDFDWGANAPAGGLDDDYFSVRWTGRPEISAGTYRFHVDVDDGVRLWVNDTLVLDEWRPQAKTFAVDVTLPASGPQKIRLEYFEATGAARVRLWWERVFPTPTATRVPPTATPTATATRVPPTATPTATATRVPPTATPTATGTRVPPTATPTATETRVPPTATPTATGTRVPPTATPTATEVPPTATPTATEVPPTATPTATEVPPTATATATEVPPTATPTATATEVPPTATPTATEVPPTATPTATATEVPPTATPTATTTQVPPTATPTATATRAPVERIAYRTVAQGMQDYSFVLTPTVAAFESAAEWEAFVRQMRGGAGGDPIPELPGVRWQREVVLAAFLGERPDNRVGVNITQVALTQRGLVVVVGAVQGGEVGTPVVTTPFHIVAISRADLPANGVDVIFTTPDGRPLGRDTLDLDGRASKNQRR